MRRWALIAATPVLSVFLGATAIAIIAALTANACPTPTGGTGDQPSATATGQIPAQLLPIYEQVGAQYDLPWEILAGIATEECDQGRLPDPSCTLQPGATGPGTANPAGASGLMQIGIGGAAGDAYDPLRQYLPNPALGPHDPTTAVQLAALVLIKDKGAPTGQPINAYLPYAAAYNGTGPAADRLRHPRHRRRQHLPRQRPDDLRRTQLRRMLSRRSPTPATSTRSPTPKSPHRGSTKASTTAAPAPSTRSDPAASSS